MNTPIGEATLGRYFLDERGQLWQHITYAASPTATLRQVGTEQYRGGCIGSPILDGFTLLVPEDEYRTA